MQAVYDLSRYPVNFNFAEFLIAAVTEGVTHINFDDSRGYKAKYPKDVTKRRFDSIVLPLCKLCGVSYSFGSGGVDFGYHMKAVQAAYSKHGHIKKLPLISGSEKRRYTVTLRTSSRYQERNSDRKSWLRFAEEIGAKVIDDYDEKPIDLMERHSLYSTADMNFFVANGPMYLCMFSDAPYMAFMKNVNKSYHNEHGFPVDKQLPWANKDQICVWSGDSYDEISSSWEKYNV